MDVINNVIETVSHLNALGYFYLALMLIPMIPGFFFFRQAIRAFSGRGGDYDISGIFVAGFIACGIVCALISAVLILVFFGGS